MQKTQVQQDMANRQLKQNQRDLQQLYDVQEELAFLYKGSSNSIKNNSQFLEYIRTFEGKDNLKKLKELLKIDNDGLDSKTI